MGAAGCSPPNEAGRQEAGVRQPGRQASRLVYVRFVAARSVFRARPLRRDQSEYKRIASLRVFDLSNRARRASRAGSRRTIRLYLRRVVVLRTAAASASASASAAAAAVRKPAEIRKREKERERPDRSRSARHGTTDSLRPVSLVSRKRKEK